MLKIIIAAEISICVNCHLKEQVRALKLIWKTNLFEILEKNIVFKVLISSVNDIRFFSYFLYQRFLMHLLSKRTINGFFLQII